MRKGIRFTWAACAAACFGLALLAVNACGGGSKADPPPPRAHLTIPADVRAQPGGSDQSGPVVARIGGVPITQAVVDSRIKMEVQEEAPAERVLPVPPRYEGCISQLRAIAGSANGAPVPPRATLLSRCRRLYGKLLAKVLSRLISSEWVIGEAAEEGIAPSEAQVRQRLEHLKATQFGTDARFRQFLSQSGENIPDLLFNIKQQLASERIRAAIDRTIPPVDDATVAHYYNEHKHDYFVKEQRDLGIVRTKSLALALRVKKQLASGTSFQAVAARLANSQPIYTVHGLLKNLEPGIYSEKNLNDAIFGARLNVVSGPVRLNLKPGFHFKNARDIQNIDGYYVFKVLRIRPAHLKTLAEVKPSLTRKLPEILRQLAVASFIRRWRSKWRARTYCASGNVIAKCRNFVPAHSEHAEDPYTLV